jgi:cytoskeletal protein CcmA (bactofilin family)
MSEKNKQDLKQEFLSGSNITQAKIEDLIDSSVNKVDDLSIDANGNVGIGTTNPSASLQVYGSSMIIGGSDHKNAQLKLLAQNTAGVTSWTSSILMEGYGGRAQGIYFADIGLPGKRWFAGINYHTGFDTYSIGYDADGGTDAQHRDKSLLTVKGSTGRVGIGTTNPSAKLGVAGDTSLDGTLAVTGATTLSDTLTVTGTGDHSFAGNVGIGTTNPGEKLEVSGNTSLDGTLAVTGATTLNSDLTVTGNFTVNGLLVEGSVGIGTTTLSEGVKLQVHGTIKPSSLSFGEINSQMINLYNDMYGIGIQASTQYCRTGKNFAWYKRGSHNDGELNAGGGTVQMVIKDGRVGIGTDDPSEKLEVSGNTSLDGTLAVTGATTLSDTLTVTGTGDHSFAGNVGIGTTNPGEKLEVSGNTSLDGTLAVTGATTLNSDLTVTGNFTVNGLLVEGSVGIGTDDPSEKLEVIGTIKCTDLTQTSDQNLKANIQPLDQGLQALMNYKPVSYDWKKEEANKKRNYGFLAQDMQALHADTSIVSGSEEDHALSISYTQLIPVLTKSIQELSEKFKNDIEKLTKKVDVLAKKVK